VRRADRTAAAPRVWRRLVVLLIILAGTPAVSSAESAGRPALQSLREQRAEQRLLAGHLLRRLGFGPNRREMHEVLRIGRAAYTERQLHPEQIDDRVGERYFHPEPSPLHGGYIWQLRWLTRMAYSRRQLQERMALIWHEHFATSVFKVGYFTLMHDQEELFRTHGLGSFRDLLIAVSRDNAMLIYLDNTYNNGQAVDGEGNRIPPNENYARELLQLFSLGVHKLNLDGTLVLDEDGTPVPAYTERDVKEVARALTGWYANTPVSMPEDPTEIVPPAGFEPYLHDPGEKLVLGEVIAADDVDPAADLERVVDVIMRQPTTAPFIAKQLIFKLATETPSPAYVKRVGAVFALRGGDLRATVRAILTDPEFYSPATVRSQYKEPIEHVIGAFRGLGAHSRGATLFYWTSVAQQQLYLPPSVFSFYRPGQKGSLVTTGHVANRDQATDMLASGYVDQFFDSTWDARGTIRRHRLAIRPARAVDLLAQDLLAAPLTPAVRQIVLDYVGPRVTEEKLRGAAWLIMCSPDYQVN